jgi:hypothetical protein
MKMMGHNMPNNLGKIIFPNKANYGPNDRADLGLQTGFKGSNLLNHLNDLSFTIEKDEGMAECGGAWEAHETRGVTGRNFWWHVWVCETFDFVDFCRIV